MFLDGDSVLLDGVVPVAILRGGEALLVCGASSASGQQDGDDEDGGRPLQ